MTSFSPRQFQQKSELHSFPEFGEDFGGLFTAADNIVPIIGNDAGKQQEAIDAKDLQAEPRVTPALPLRSSLAKKSIPEGCLKNLSPLTPELDLSLPPRPTMPPFINSEDVYKPKPRGVMPYRPRTSKRARDVPSDLPSLGDTESKATLPRNLLLSRTTSFVSSMESRLDSSQVAQKHKDEVLEQKKTSPSDENAIFKLSPHAPDFQPHQLSSSLFNPVPFAFTPTLAVAHPHQRILPPRASENPQQRVQPTSTTEHYQPQASPSSGPKNNNGRSWSRKGHPHSNKHLKNGGFQRDMKMAFAGQPQLHPPLPQQNGVYGGPAPLYNGFQGSLAQSQFYGPPNPSKFQSHSQSRMQQPYPTHASAPAFSLPTRPLAQSYGASPPTYFYNRQLPGSYTTLPNTNPFTIPPSGHKPAASGYQLPNHIRVVYPLNQAPNLNQIHPQDLALPPPEQGYYEITKSGPLWKPGPFNDSNLHSRAASVAVSATEEKKEDAQALNAALEGLSLKEEVEEGEQGENLEEKEVEPVQRKTVYF
jgi:hypothetical protein